MADAVAGNDLEGVAAGVAEALDCPVAIAIPGHGAPVVAPAGSLTADAVGAIATRAVAMAAGWSHPGPAALAPIAEAVPVRIGDQVVGIVVATAGSASPDRRAWLEAAAAAASVTALIRDAPGGDAGAALMAELARSVPEDVPGVVARARRLGVDLSAGAVALSARGSAVSEMDTRRGGDVLVAEIAAGRLIALGPATASDDMAALADGLREAGMTAAVSAPRRDPALLHEAIREAELLAELDEAHDGPHGGHDETYRLLIGVLLRDRAELAQLRESTVTPLAHYDAGHDTELLATLRAFLAHDGSTTETAEAMRLHRHTVGYRLSRVHEVSGLSPYESDGRERLSLGVKAHQILDADRRLGGDGA